MLVISSRGPACHCYSVVSEQSGLAQILQSPGSSCIRWASLGVCSWTHSVDKFINNSPAVAGCYSWQAAWARGSIDFKTLSWQAVDLWVVANTLPLCFFSLVSLYSLFFSFFFALKSIFPTWSLLFAFPLTARCQLSSSLFSFFRIKVK